MRSSHCDVLLIRHGQTSWNAAGKVQGHSDIPLNETGEAQAHALGEKLRDLPFSAAYSSDLVRAMRTAQIVVRPRELRILEAHALRERGMGAWEGRVIPKYNADMTTDDSIRHRSQEEYLTCRVDARAESYADVFARVQRFLTELSVRHCDELVLLSSHAGVLSAILYHLDFRMGLHWSIANCGHIMLRAWSDGRLELLKSEGLSVKPYFCLCQAKADEVIRC